MDYSLGGNWSFCVDGKMIVLMDVEANAYLALPPLLATSFDRLRKGEDPRSEDTRPLQTLIGAGIITVGSKGSAICPCAIANPPTSEIEERHLNRPRISDVLRAAVNLSQMHRALKRKKFSTVIADLDACKKPKSDCGLEIGNRAREIASAFHWLNTFVTRHDQCLLRSLAMIKSLRMNGVPSTMIFGIATRPFSAHCWIQYQDVVLNDTIEGVRSYIPILEL